MLTTLEMRFNVADESNVVDVTVLSEIVNALNKLDPDARRRMLDSVATLFGMSMSRGTTDSIAATLQSADDVRPSFSEDRSLTPKEFVWQKQPKTAIERVACLAFYLTHYRGMQFFKTVDITALNMEAAQVKFSNPHMMVSEATRAGYLTSAGGQSKQLTVLGEQFVRLLPNRQAAYDAIKGMKPKRQRRKNSPQEQQEKDDAQ